MNKLLCLLICCYFIAPCPSLANVGPTAPALAFQQLAKASYQSSIHIPLKRVGNLFFIEARIDDRIGNFVLDLGAPYLVLNSTYFRDYKVDERYTSGTLLSEADYVKRIKVKRLELNGLQLDNLSADVTDLGQIENQKDIKILGLLGVALFEDYLFDLDVLNKQLVLHKNWETVDVDAEMVLKAPIVVQNNVISLKAKCQKVTLYLSLDTGSEKNIIDNKLPQKVYNQMKILKTSTIRDGNGKKTEALLTVMDGIFVEEIKLRKMYTIVLNLKTLSRAYGRRIDGMLGYPFFSLGRVFIDFKDKKLSVYQFKPRE
ncbi:MAG: aspartyl protease family protein [Bacteroidota bacterium]